MTAQQIQKDDGRVFFFDIDNCLYHRNTVSLKAGSSHKLKSLMSLLFSGNICSDGKEVKNGQGGSDVTPIL